MLKGHVFSKQLFGNPIFALFINTFLNGANGVSNNYKNAMALSHSGNNITVQSGAVCIQGRFVEEDTSSTIPVGTDTAFCKLVIEIDLDKQNTESELNQVAYKIIKGVSSYPNLTQTNIVKNNAGIYQYELARFKTTGTGITDFQDMRTFLDISSIFTQIRTSLNTMLSDLNTQFQTLFNTSESDLQDLIAQIQSELDQVEDESIYLLKSGGTANGDFNFGGNVICNNLKNSNGSNVIYKDNFVVLTGTFSNTGQTDRSVNIPFPDGYNHNNSIVVSYDIYFIYEWYHEITSGANLQKALQYNSSGLQARVKGVTDKIDYRIVLLKIS